MKYVWADDGRPSPRHPAADYIRAQASDFSGSPKKKRWNPQKERYMDFTVSFGIVRPEDSDLNMSPEGKMRRQLMNQHDCAIHMVPITSRPPPCHYWDQSLNTKIDDAEQRQSSNLLVNMGKHPQSRK